MTTPFKALNPFTPRFIEINYIAPDGGCCAMSSSSGSQQSLPDDDPPDPVPDFFQYFFNVPSFGSTWMLWVQDPSNPTERILIEEFLVADAGLLDITEYFLNTENTSLPGTQRKVFITLQVPSSGGNFEGAQYTSFIDQTGAMSLEVWSDVPEYDPLDGWTGSDDVQMVVIENYQNSIATFEVVDSP